MRWRKKWLKVVVSTSLILHSYSSSPPLFFCILMMYEWFKLWWVGGGIEWKSYSFPLKMITQFSFSRHGISCWMNSLFVKITAEGQIIIWSGWWFVNVLFWCVSCSSCKILHKWCLLYSGGFYFFQHRKQEYGIFKHTTLSRGSWCCMTWSKGDIMFRGEGDERK